MMKQLVPKTKMTMTTKKKKTKTMTEQMGEKKS